MIFNKFSVITSLRFTRNPPHRFFSVNNKMAQKYSQQDLVNVAKIFVPKMSHKMYKGQCGRISVVGGCAEYTGAPYFAAISALKVGADLSHVFCTQGAAPVIKSYSPELIVHPYLDANNAVDDIAEWLPRMHAVVLGPGLGRDPSLFENIKGVIEKIRQQGIPLVLDADGVYFVTQEPSMIKGYTKAILTPNAVEFSRLFEKVFNERPKTDALEEGTMALSDALGKVTVVRKGEADIISNGKITVSCSNEGSVRRCGGQGDLLSGSMGTFAYWAQNAAQCSSNDSSLLKLSPTVCAAYAACFLTRECNRVAYAQHQRSMTTSDMISVIGPVFQQHFEHEDLKQSSKY